MTPEEKQQILDLHAAGRSNAEIAIAMNRSETAIYQLVKRHELVVQTPQVLSERMDKELSTDKSVFDRTQLQVAAHSLQAAHDLVRSIRAMTLSDLMKVPVHQRAIAAGVLLDKFRLLTEQSTDNILTKTQSIVEIIARATPKRAKDS